MSEVSQPTISNYSTFKYCNKFFHDYRLIEMKSSLNNISLKLCQFILACEGP